MSLCKDVFGDARQPEVNCIHLWVVLPLFSVKSPLWDYRRLAIQIWKCCGKLKEIGVHFRLMCFAKKRLCFRSFISRKGLHAKFKILTLLLTGPRRNWRTWYQDILISRLRQRRWWGICWDKPGIEGRNSSIPFILKVQQIEITIP